MYIVSEIHKEGLDYLELKNTKGNTVASFCLDQGGRLCDLLVNNTKILASFHPSDYKNNYASSILFPFANRIKNGKYTFDNLNYQLECNDVDKNNALHGLVYDKLFHCVGKTETTDYASIKLSYDNETVLEGFPFKFKIQLLYTLNASGLSLSVKVYNLDSKAFPFALGWHPYFYSSNFGQSYIDFNADETYIFDAQKIIIGTQKLASIMPMHLKKLKLDDGYPLNSNTITLFTPNYNLKMHSTSEENFLQIYTLNNDNAIAIEPMTGAADNFNNKKGLKILKPNGSYEVVWNLNIENVS